MKLLMLLCLFVLVTAQDTFWPMVHHREMLRPPFIRKWFITDDEIKEPALGHDYHVGLIADETGFCSGSLVTEQKVLTTAQCLNGATNIAVHLGALRLYEETEPQRLIVNASEYKLHENFNSINPLDFDIAIITLPEAVSGAGFSPIRLPRHSDNRTFDGYSVHASGWGRTDASKVTDLRSIRNELARSSMGAISNLQCSGTMGPIISDNHLCAFGPSISSCYGDAGSPLALLEMDEEYTQIGIASFGSWSGCETGSPQVFTRVTSFLDWIQDQGVPIMP